MLLHGRNLKKHGRRCDQTQCLREAKPQKKGNVGRWDPLIDQWARTAVVTKGPQIRLECSHWRTTRGRKIWDKNFRNSLRRPTTPGGKIANCAGELEKGGRTNSTPTRCTSKKVQKGGEPAKKQELHSENKWQEQTKRNIKARAQQRQRNLVNRLANKRNKQASSTQT